MQELAKSDAADFNPHTEMSTNRERLSLVFHKPHCGKPDTGYVNFQLKAQMVLEIEAKKGAIDFSNNSARVYNEP